MAQPVGTGATLANPIFRAYLFYGSILIFKMMAMSLLTAMHRIINRAFVNPEDAKNMNVKLRTDDQVERVRRAHLNDLENITLFFIAGYFYILTNPAMFLAVNLFRLYVISRIIHTIVYAVLVMPQPARAFSWFAGFAVTGYMTLMTFVTFLTSW